VPQGTPESAEQAYRNANTLLVCQGWDTSGRFSSVRLEQRASRDSHRRRRCPRQHLRSQPRRSCNWKWCLCPLRLCAGRSL